MANVYSGSDPKNKLRVREVDGTPNVFPVSTIVVSNDTLTNDGGGQVTITTGGGGGGSVSITADNTGTTFVDATVSPSPITGTGTISVDLNATGTTDGTTFLRGDNTFTNVLTGDASFGGSVRIGNTGAASAPLQVNSTAARVGFIVSSVSGSYLEFFDLNTSGLNYVNIGATGDALTFKSNDVQFRMPTSDGATPGEYLITDAAGALSFSPFPTAQPTPDPGLGVAGVTAALQAAGIFI